LPDLLIQQIFELFVGCQGEQRKGIVRTDFSNQEVKVFLGKSVHQGGRLGIFQYPLQRFFGWQRQAVPTLGRKVPPQCRDSIVGFNGVHEPYVALLKPVVIGL
jgi:hypothetical protein